MRYGVPWQGLWWEKEGGEGGVVRVASFFLFAFVYSCLCTVEMWELCGIFVEITVGVLIKLEQNVMEISVYIITRMIGV